MYVKVLCGLAATLASFSAMAVNKTITVTATVDSNVEMVQQDNTPLPTTLDLAYLPGVGLRGHKISTIIYSNDHAVDLQLQLVTATSLTAPGVATPVPLTISYNGKKLAPGVDLPLLAAEAFQGGPTDSSVVMSLDIDQTTPGPITASGTYTGLVNLSLVQAP